MTTSHTLVRGDAAQFDLTFLQENNSPVDLTGAIIKFAAKADKSDPNSDALVFKKSYDASEIAITSATNGLASVYVQPHDTMGQAAGQYFWEVELTKQGSAVAGVGGTIAVATDSGVINATLVTGLGLIKPGMVLVPTGALPANQKPVTVTSVDEVGLTITTDYEAFDAEGPVNFTVRQGDRHTPTGMSGTLTVEADVVL